jgi:hypothetical protein
MRTLPHVVIVCICTHSKREHWCTKSHPRGGCLSCDCATFTPESVCQCGHGKKAHLKGRCHEGDGCQRFRPRST